ncbi:MAG: GNAT family N-acetyltransferase, partial [bacterium]
MTKIHRLKLTDIQKIKEMMEYVKPGVASNIFFEGKFTLFPVDILHDLLPINKKFLQECYVASKDKELLGLIGLIPDGKQKTRWKINRLVLDTNAYEVGKQLIDYVVNKYGGAGVETFITAIDENYAEAIALFKNACGFRSYTKIHIWEKDNPKVEKLSQDLQLLREVKSFDARNLYELDQESLFPQFRTSLTKNISDFKFGLESQLINSFRNLKVKRFVLDNPARNAIEGYIWINSRDNKNFWVDIVLSLAYQDYYEDLLNYVIKYINKQNQNIKLYIY